MWIVDKDNGKWSLVGDSLPKETFDVLKQELSKIRFYSKCLSGATYLPINNFDNVYDILSNDDPKNWYISVIGSPYSISIIPPQHATPITSTSSAEYYDKYVREYGMTLKNLFTPNRLIKDSINNFVYVDVATTEHLTNLGQTVINLTIDGIRLKEGHRVLVKDQKSSVVLPISTDPNSYFISNYYVVQNLGLTIEYEFYNSDNGIYIYKNNKLVRESDLDNYDDCVRYSISVKLGNTNRETQWHLSRLLNGYFPVVSESNPVEFIEKHNWILRNRVDYNNIFDINYYDVIKHATQSYFESGITYSIPERTIAVGEFGMVLNTQELTSHIIPNKYKVNLRSIVQNTKYYWVCGDNGILLRIRKHDFEIKKIDIPVDSSLKSISFFNDLRGVAVGDINTILVTNNGGDNWEKIQIDDFNPYSYNKVVYSTINTFYIGGDSGIFIEFTFSGGSWTAYKRRVAKYIDDDEYLLVEDINDLYKTTITSWGLSYSYSTQSIPSNKDLLFIVTNNGNIIAHDISDAVPEFDFLYLDFGVNYGDITSITRRDNTDNFYFSSDSLYSFDINNFQYISTSQSNIITGSTGASIEHNAFINEMFDYNGIDLIICGNNALLESSTYSLSFNFEVLDPTFEDKLRSKMLYLDYDIGSKLNFFTDDQDYRLPNSLTFSGSSFSVSSYLAFSPLIYGPTAPSFITITESNWGTYWTDRQKTFEFCSSSPLDNSTKALMSLTFSYYTTATPSTQAYFTSSTVTTNLWDILPLAPNITNNNLGRYNIGTGSISAPTASETVFIYDYLMVVKTGLTNPAQIGDVIRIESDIVDGNFIINKIYNSGFFKYLYFFTEFNQSIINQIKSSSSIIKITNLNKYKDIIELEDRFNLHPISNAYEMIYSTSSNIVDINPIFNNYTAYYNLATSVNVSGDFSTMSYVDSFLNFGYKPTYNLLSYLENLNPDVFYATKEYLALPVYNGIPLGPLTASNAYIDTNGITYSNTTGNKILFGSGLKLEWESLFINTFVDVIIYGSSTYSTERLLVMKKYYDQSQDAYVVEFHKKMNFTLFDPAILSGGSLDISSRRTLQQISDDLQELNGLQRMKGRITEIYPGFEYTSYENELNFKIPTDSYAKAILSDNETIQELSAIIYVDYKNELSMNITRLDREFNVPILNTSNFSGKLYISCSEEHDLSTGDGVVLEFNGGTGSSEQINQNYFGFHTVTVVTDYDFYTEVPYGNIPSVGNDIGFVRYVKKDPFFNYQPIDLIDVGVDGKGKKSIELLPENVDLEGDIYKLIDVDFNRYRFRLVDSLNLDILNSKYPWILEAEITNAIIGMDSNQELIWYSGNWECGRWFGGRWVSGVWKSGDWYAGTWDSKFITNKLLSVEVDNVTVGDQYSTWFGGRWFDGTWNGGTWYDGRWYGGTWSTGNWFNGIWNDGLWLDGDFIGGIWVLGQWDGGIFNTNNKPAYWLDGRWYGGDFENGMWYNGIFDQKNGKKSRFGTNAFNSRTATWHGGKWITGEFHSKLNTNDDGITDVSDTHKYSIWNTGIWSSGNWYGGVAYDIDFRSGTWHGGILEDIQLIGIDTTIDTFTLNGIFKFNIGDDIYIIDNQVGNTYSVYGNNTTPGKYKVLNTVEDVINKWTTIYVNFDLSTLGTFSFSGINTELRVVSKFTGADWKSGIWTNGIFEKGLWEGGIWYNGVFNNGIWM